MSGERAVPPASLDPVELREAIRSLLEVASDSQAVRGADKEFRSRLWGQMAGLGWFGLAIGEEFGGLGLGFAELAILYEELGRHVTPVAVMPTLLAAQAIATAGSQSQKQRWLPSIASGEVSAAIALPRGEGVISIAGFERDVRLNGKVPHVLDADGAHLLLLPVIDPAGELGLALIERRGDGITVLQRPAFDQTRSLNEVIATDVHVSSDRMLRLPAAAWTALLDHASVALACDSIGGAAHILEKTVEYLKTRVQFDRPIGSFQALKHRAASWKILQEAAAALTSQAAQMLAADDHGRSVWASNAKFYACDAYAAIAGDAIQLHGGIGFTWEHDCHLFFKRAKLNQVLFGSSVDHKERVAERIFAARALGAASSPQSISA